MQLKIERTEGSTCGEYDLLMLASDGTWDWLRTCESKKDAAAKMREEYAECAASDGAERHYRNQCDYACGYWD